MSEPELPGEGRSEPRPRRKAARPSGSASAKPARASAGGRATRGRTTSAKLGAAKAAPQAPPDSGAILAGVPEPAHPEPTPGAPPATQPAARQRIWISGGAGFIGRAVVRELLDRGYDVVAAVRDPRRAQFLTDLGATVVQDDLSDVAALTEALRDVDAVIHAAGSYKVGIPRDERGAMWDANIGTTTRVLDAAEAAGTKRIVYVSTVNVFGNTRGQVVDEAYKRDLAEGFLSWYDQTKYGAHEVALQRIAGGAPIVIVQPSQVYGPGDHSGYGEQLRLAFDGKLAYRALPGLENSLVHVDDLAAGIVAALEKGTAGEAYILAGPRISFDDAVTIAAKLGGRKVPFAMPEPLIRALAPFGQVIGQPNLREVLASSLHVTYLGSSEKAERELGFHARPVEDGLRATFGVPPASRGTEA